MLNMKVFSYYHTQTRLSAGSIWLKTEISRCLMKVSKSEFEVNLSNGLYSDIRSEMGKQESDPHKVRDYVLSRIPENVTSLTVFVSFLSSGAAKLMISRRHYELYIVFFPICTVVMDVNANRE